MPPVEHNPFDKQNESEGQHDEYVVPLSHAMSVDTVSPSG